MRFQVGELVYWSLVEDFAAILQKDEIEGRYLVQQRDKDYTFWVFDMDLRKTSYFEIFQHDKKNGKLKGGQNAEKSNQS